MSDRRDQPKALDTVPGLGQPSLTARACPPRSVAVSPPKRLLTWREGEQLWGLTNTSVITLTYE